VKKYPIKLNLIDIPETKINHGSGIKKVFIKNGDTKTSLTQFAWSKLEKNEECERHSHPTMDEYFFVYKGKGTYEIGDDHFELNEGDFIQIPANTPHRLSVNTSQSELELIYFGIALDK